jgi:carboxylesterase type B
MDANVGLHDGVAALQWTKDYISHFGGDPSNIAAIGESAGGAMIALMLVANEGNGTLPFQKVRDQQALPSLHRLTIAGIHIIARYSA